MPWAANLRMHVSKLRSHATRSNTPAASQTLEDLAAGYGSGPSADARVVRLVRLIQEHRGLSKYLNDFSSSIERCTSESAFATPGCQARWRSLMSSDGVLGPAPPALVAAGLHMLRYVMQILRHGPCTLVVAFEGVHNPCTRLLVLLITVLALWCLHAQAGQCRTPTLLCRPQFCQS